MKYINIKDKIDWTAILCWVLFLPALLSFYSPVYVATSNHVKVEKSTYYFMYLGSKTVNSQQRYYFKDSRKHDGRVYYLDHLKDQNVHYYRDINSMEPFKINSYFQNLVWNGLGQHSWLSEITTDLESLKLNLPSRQINKQYIESYRDSDKTYPLVRGDRNFEFKGLYAVYIVYIIFVALPSAIITFVVLFQILKSEEKTRCEKLSNQ